MAYNGSLGFIFSILCQAIWFTIEKSTLEGPVNCVAPNPVRNADLARAIGQGRRKDHGSFLLQHS